MATPSSLLLSRADLDFLLHDWLDAGSLTSRERFTEHSRETFDAVLDVCAEIAAERFAPHNKRNDIEEPRFDPTGGGRVVLHDEVRPALDALAGTGLLAATADASVGGLQLPHVVRSACVAWFAAANIATWGYAFLTAANANLLLAHGSDAQIDTWVRPMLEGRFHGTMCLSETQAGSSLADVSTRAEPQDDGTYRLTGTKMWISAGDHELGENIVHLVLAKIPGGPAGVKGISLFVVPKFLAGGADGNPGEHNDVVLAGLNHKMGYRGTTNTVLNLGEGRHTPGGAAGAVGYLVGEPHRGLTYMFHMMNEARIGVGAGAAALGYTAYLKSLDYARTRPQGRPVTGRDPGQPQVPIVEHADVRRMLLAQKSYAEGALALVLYCGRLLDEQETAPEQAGRDRAGLLLDVLTPIAKSWPSQWCLAGNDLAIQVLGGYGYTREYDVEQHYRDNRLNPIHEGTHGIQAIDLLGRRTAAAGGAGLDALDGLLAATIARARAGGDEEAGRYADQLDAARARLMEVTRALHAEPDATVRLANASIHLEAAGHVVLAWIWLEQLLAAGGRDDDLGNGKRAAARYFFHYELPRTGPQLDLLAALDRTTTDLDPSWL
ncbi:MULTISPECIES: acyl-CoA dehydrogenase [Pseudonocardia]|uniref:Acyl-CoA dehydrogenase, short-chain specific n=2 Tax=Pseudonocardia TaxID=1847 RepID=A0A1Y2N7X8_PSEAH|nr:MULTISPECIES: acyl-CoA dehydrogenase [Pseudonocardia]OSY43572.1 Acyl-CoA dehydrogenase, short-chain specific [Pseudonocardia autotrophica]TDN73437.1 butyryl-CoA dehydrogenase [Pseudonocardia autotrophica]BBG04176.1 acyl-CoA dehydrogenase [Pseudonocardia autotrophica]GEC25507.1 acyl-CoA dehydrogenase [Pseudonocardia saturnea]